MDKGELFSAAVNKVGDIAFYPLEHPVKTAKIIGIGGVAIAAPILTLQLSMLHAEHGPRKPANNFDAEQVDEHQETPEV